jgi:HSP20 family protein
VTVSGGSLAIQAERHQDPAARCHSEFRYGSYARSIPLPAAADEERIRAIYSHGVLEITVDLKDERNEIPRQVRVMVDHHIDPT